MHEVILVINAGSSSIKFSLFSVSNLSLYYQGEIENVNDKPRFILQDASHKNIQNCIIKNKGYPAALNTLFDWFQTCQPIFTIKIVGHRVVHGGGYFTKPTLITPSTIKKMEQLNPLAPLHQPHNIEAIKIIRRLFPTLKQVACFDTTFHLTQDKLAKQFALPKAMTKAGIIRYGFHGLSYEYIASILTKKIGTIGNQRIIIAHLGNGASMCGIYQRKSVATTMGFTALDGLMMGTRVGTLDPGVLLYLLQEKKMNEQKLSTLLYEQSGLLGVSSISHDMRTLLTSKNPNAKNAIDLFCYRAAREAGSLIIALGGCDVFVFTAGIGEHAPFIRKKIGEYLACHGLKINQIKNKNHELVISDKHSKILTCIIPTNEEWMLAKHVQRFIGAYQ